VTTVFPLIDRVQSKEGKTNKNRGSAINTAPAKDPFNSSQVMKKAKRVRKDGKKEAIQPQEPKFTWPWDVPRKNPVENFHQEASDARELIRYEIEGMLEKKVPDRDLRLAMLRASIDHLINAGEVLAWAFTQCRPAAAPAAAPLEQPATAPAPAVPPAAAAPPLAADFEPLMKLEEAVLHAVGIIDLLAQKIAPILNDKTSMSEGMSGIVEAGIHRTAFLATDGLLVAEKAVQTEFRRMSGRNGGVQ
jgi:hypothetical protein